LGDLAVGHVGQACQHVAKIGKRVKTASAAVFNDGVDDRAALTGIRLADEEPVLFADGRGSLSVMAATIPAMSPRKIPAP
jgi:hypothetical protein